MKTVSNRKYSNFTLRHSSGLGLLDIILAIVIFVIGMLALASLQGNLTRSSMDANSRTVGTNLAEEFIERLRTFGAIRATTTCPASDLELIAAEDIYQCIEDGTATVTRGGLDYTVAATVTDLYFEEDGVTITDDVSDLPSSWDTTISSFKFLELAVNWTANPDFIISEGVTDTLGSGSFTVSSIIPSTPQLGSASVAADDDGEMGTPPINYMPGQRPDIVAIDLSGSKFKESTTPKPDVIRSNELVETWFDVVTYNTTGNDSVYLRREEFVVLSCECSLNDAPGGDDGSGFLPTVWNGESYTEGAWVDKAYGVSANNQQSSYCDTCCRDHHDSPSYTGSHEVFDPARLVSPGIPVWSQGGGLDGDHKHFKRANQGGLSEAGNNQTYVEACRMVRKDGYMRVAQDFRQEGLISFPAGYLDTEAGVTGYSTYVTDSVEDFYLSGGDSVAPPSDFGYDFPADKLDALGVEDLLDTTSLPLLGLNSQQMRSRGVYIDTIGPELSKLLECIDDDTAYADCSVPDGVSDPLQVLPFYDIQTTWLSAWASDPLGTPVTVSSDAIADDNSHSRGLATLVNTSSTIQVRTDTEMHRGNIGLTGTDPITELDDDAAAKLDHSMWIDLNGGGGTPDSTGYTWSGTFGSGVNQVNAADATVTALMNTFCSRSGTALSCVTPLNEAGSITISGYTRKQGQNWVPYWICLSNFPNATIDSFVADGANNSTTISWPAGTNPTGVTISIESSACN